MQPRWKKSQLASEVATIATAVLALLVALYAPEAVFGLVLTAWSALAASTGSMPLLRIVHLPFSTVTAASMMATS